MTILAFLINWDICQKWKQRKWQSNEKIGDSTKPLVSLTKEYVIPNGISYPIVFYSYPLSVSIRQYQTKFDFNLATAALSQIFGGLLYSKGSSIKVGHLLSELCRNSDSIHIRQHLSETLLIDLLSKIRSQVSTSIPTAKFRQQMTNLYDDNLNPIKIMQPC